MALPCLLDDTRRQGNRYPDELIRCIMNDLVACNHVCSILSLQIQSLLYNIGADLASAFCMCLGAYRPRRPQAASDSNAASRQQTQKNNIASSDPRLVKNAPVGGPFFCELRSFHESVAAERRI